MATRGIIARKTNNGFEGVYHHWDSYPSGLGQMLYRLYNGHFRKNIRKMMSYLIDMHPAGWSTINDADFTIKPGFINMDHEEHLPERERRRPRCYCHGDRHERPRILSMASDTLDCEYAYAIDEGTRCMTIYTYRWRGNSGKWDMLTTADLNAPPPDWERLDVA